MSGIHHSTGGVSRRPWRLPLPTEAVLTLVIGFAAIVPISDVRGAEPDASGIVKAMRGYQPGVGESRELIEHCHAVAAAHGRPGTQGAEFVAWGEPSAGLRAGLLIAPRVEAGGRLPAWIVIRNVSSEPLTSPFALSWNTTRIVAQDSRGASLEVDNPKLRGGDAIVQCVLAPGEQIEVQTQPVQFGGSPADGFSSRIQSSAGRCAIQLDLGAADLRHPADAGRPRLLTGLATIEVTPPKDRPVQVGFTGSPGSSSRVRGTLTDRTGEPLSGIVIWIMGPDKRLNLHSEPTGDDGRFEINDAPIGTSWCVVLQPDGRPNLHSEVLTLTGRGNRELNVRYDGDSISAHLLPVNRPGVPITEFHEG